MSMKSFFFSKGMDRAPSYEVNGPWNKGDPVHENLTLLTLKEAIESLRKRDTSRALGSLLSGIEFSKLPQWNSKDHHDFDPRKAPESTQEFLRGVYWPDDPRCYFFPEDRGTRKYSLGAAWLTEFRKGKKGNIKNAEQLIARSHFGDLQFFHAMAFKLNESAKETRENILSWARLNVEVASGRLGPETQLKDIQDERLSKAVCFFRAGAHADWSIKDLLAGGQKRGKSLSAIDARQRATGILLHLIQDSFATGHVERNEAGAIRQFHDYGSQDPHQHGNKDKMGRGEVLSQHIDATPGARQAITSGARVVALMDSGQPVDEVMKYFEEEIFKLAADVRAAGPGEEFKGRDKTRLGRQLQEATAVAKAAFFRTGRTGQSVQVRSFSACDTQAIAEHPGAWRGGPGTEVAKVIATTIGRMRKSKAAGIQILEETIESLFTRAILDNKHVTNQQIIDISKQTLDSLAKAQGTTDKDREWVLKKVPGARETQIHKFTVALMAAATHHVNEEGKEDTFSWAFPDLGLTGAINTPLMMHAKTEKAQLSTALHDFTDYMRCAGIQGVNKAVWGVEDRVLSAFVSIRGEGRY